MRWIEDLRSHLNRSDRVEVIVMGKAAALDLIKWAGAVAVTSESSDAVKPSVFMGVSIVPTRGRSLTLVEIHQRGYDDLPIILMVRP